MRPLCLALALVGLAAHAQPTLDISAAAGAIATGSSEVLVPSLDPVATVAATLAPGLPRGVRVKAEGTIGPGSGRFHYGRLAALGLGVEAPFSGGRDGVYLALGGAVVDFDNYDPTGCVEDPNCMFEGASVAAHTGLAWTGGLGARVSVGRLFAEPALSAMVWHDVLIGAQLGLGWRLR